MGNYFNINSSNNISTNNQKIIKLFNIKDLQISQDLALNGNYFVKFTHKIVPAIIINFIYYRHSNLNVISHFFMPDVRIRFFLPFITFPHYFPELLLPF